MSSSRAKRNDEDRFPIILLTVRMPSINGSIPKNKVTAAVGTPAISKTEVITITVALGTLGKVNLYPIYFNVCYINLPNNG